MPPGATATNISVIHGSRTNPMTGQISVSKAALQRAG